jgi:hypothetical protein
MNRDSPLFAKETFAQLVIANEVKQSNNTPAGHEDK